MSILDRHHADRAGRADVSAAWDQLLSALQAPEPAPVHGPRHPAAECHWVPDPNAPGRLICVWTATSDT